MAKRVIVTLCGSTRSMDEYVAAQRRETLAGRIVISVGLFGHQEGLVMDGPVKAMLDGLHLDKIDISDEILVIDVPMRRCPSCGSPWRDGRVRVERCSCGVEIGDIPPAPYVGESTRREIAHAEAAGKRVRYLSKERG